MCRVVNQTRKKWWVCVCGLQLLLKAGGEGKHTVFLFADSQIKDESFMEDISMILNTGDVPNLYAADEKAEIIEKMQGMARKEVPYHAVPRRTAHWQFLVFCRYFFCSWLHAVD